ncbi:uncharacterized protein LOC113227772 [Hyposmocoma kahamanoa]|uniref:uncharacterized protein LOC113227772 n=1 Tax=Hyposmocoma kahamanoa TaxID=1477025 RepID=UPI000E6D5C42|nr:uncharacterized protein LOC113227772 [Hyposmocoma kahamanoa]
MRALLLLLTISMLSILTTSTPIDLARALANSRTASSDAADGAAANRRAANEDQQPLIIYQTSYLPHTDEIRRSDVKSDPNKALRKGEYKCKGKTCKLDPSLEPPLCGDSPCQHPLLLMDPKEQWTT